MLIFIFVLLFLNSHLLPPYYVTIYGNLDQKWFKKLECHLCHGKCLDAIERTSWESMCYEWEYRKAAPVTDESSRQKQGGFHAILHACVVFHNSVSRLPKKNWGNSRRMYEKVSHHYKLGLMITRIILSIWGLTGNRNLVYLPQIHDTSHVLTIHRTQHTKKVTSDWGHLDVHLRYIANFGQKKQLYSSFCFASLSHILCLRYWRPAQALISSRYTVRKPHVSQWCGHYCGCSWG